MQGDNPRYPPPRSTDDMVAPNLQCTEYRKVAQGLDGARAHGVVASICEARDADGGDYRADFSPAADRILLAVENALPPGCIADELTRRASGEVNGVVLETLPPGVTYASPVGRGRNPVPERVDGTGAAAREVCRVGQRIPTADDRAQGVSPLCSPRPGAHFFFGVERNLGTPEPRTRSGGATP
jgi:hypothetical protein